MTLPKMLQQLVVGDLRRVIVDLDGLRVITNVSISWMCRCAAGISNSGTNNSLNNPEPGFDTPKSAKPKRGGGNHIRLPGIDWCHLLFFHCLH